MERKSSDDEYRKNDVYIDWRDYDFRVYSNYNRFTYLQEEKY